jgi:hypothetical protein
MSESLPPSRPRFPIARKLLRFAGHARRNWLERHRHPVSFGLHMLGIPLSLLVAPGLLFVLPWYWGAGAFVFGYFLQWVGHRIEGNDVGELIPLKRALGLPVVAIAPRYAIGELRAGARG